MSKKISFFINIIVVFLLTFNCLVALELTIIPLEKPVIEKAIKEKKISKNITKPQKKPIKEVASEVKQVDEIKKEKKRYDIIVPKTKPLIVKKEKSKLKKTSKYYRKKDFALAKKAITEMEKRKWVAALSTAKKARDKSI